LLPSILLCETSMVRHIIMEAPNFLELRYCEVRRIPLPDVRE
jgi:hypothetical protein